MLCDKIVTLVLLTICGFLIKRRSMIPVAYFQIAGAKQGVVMDWSAVSLLSQGKGALP